MSDPSDGREVIVISQAAAVDVLGVPVPPGYTNHIGSGRDPAGTVFWAVTVDGPNSGDVDVAIMRRDVATAAWEEVYRFDERTYGKHGYGTLQPLPNGSLSCGLSERNASGQTVAIERIVPAANARVVWTAPSGGGGSAFVPAPGNYIRLHAGPLANGQQLPINLGEFGIPAGVAFVNIKLTISAAAPDIRGCIGPHAGSGGAAMLKVETQRGNGGVVGKGRIYGEGQRPPGANNTLVLMAEGGDLVECFADVTAWGY